MPREKTPTGSSGSRKHTARRDDPLDLDLGGIGCAAAILAVAIITFIGTVMALAVLP